MPNTSGLRDIKRQLKDVADSANTTEKEIKDLQKSLEGLGGSTAVSMLNRLNNELHVMREAWDFIREHGTSANRDITHSFTALISKRMQLNAQQQRSLNLTQQQVAASRQAAAVGPPGAGIGGAGGQGLNQLGTAQIIRGTAADVAALTKDTQLVKAAAAAQKLLQDQWAISGVKLSEFTFKIDAVNRSLQVTADLTGAQAAGGQQLKIAGRLPTLDFDIDKLKEITKTDTLTAYFRSVGQGSDAFNRLAQAAQKAGFSIEDFDNKTAQSNDGLTTFKFKSVDASGAMQRGSVIMDRNGQVVSSVKQKYESLTGAISNSVNKVLRWGIAVGLVYGSLNKLRQAIDEMITLETAMADIQIITGKSLNEMGDAFDNVVEAAKETGTTLGEAASAFEKALRAAGQYADEAERVEKATVLVSDALVLARLGNLTTAEAMDRLTGALRQQGLELDQGEQLLDKWVATSKTAFVSVGDLAESFAITAAQAKAVGVSIDELNGVIGTIAEVTTLSSTEIGNMGRRMLAFVESDIAVKTLRDYGVAVKGVGGEFRAWGDIMQDIFDLYQAGAISEKDLSAIGRAIGGGIRGGPQTVAFMKEYGRVSEIAAESANASGDAAAALEIKMDTLKNAVSKLQVALSVLASAAGEEGGLLDFLTNLVDLSTSVTGALSGVTAALGSVTTQVVALSVAMIAMKKINLGGRIGAQFGGIASRQMLVARQAAGGGGATGREVLASMTGPALATIGRGIGVGAITYMATGSAAQGVGAGIGGAIGSVLGGPVGLLAGSLMGQAIGQGIEQHLQVSDIYQKVQRGDEISPEQAFKDLSTLVNALRDPLDKIANRGPVEATGGQFIEAWGARTTEELLAAGTAWATRVREELATLGVAGEDVYDTAIGGRLEAFETLAAILQEDIDATKENTEALKAAAVPDAFALETARLQEQYRPATQAVFGQERAEKIQQLAAGDIPRATYTRFLGNQQAAEQATLQIFQYMEERLDEFGGKSQDVFTDLALSIAELDPAGVEYILDALSEIVGLTREYDDLASSATATASQLVYNERLQLEIAEKQGILADEINAMFAAAKAQAEELHRPAFTRRGEDFTSDMAAQVEALARANQEEYAKGLSLDPVKFAEQAEPFNEIWENNLHRMHGVHKIFWDDAVRLVEEAKQKMDDTFSVRRLKDVGPERFGEIQARNRYWVEYLARLRGQSAQQYLGEEGFEENLIMGPNNVWNKLLTTNEAMNFTLQDILETEKKQLEGMWNIPQGAAFWVPITSLFYQAQGGAGGVPELPPLEMEDAVADGIAKSGLLDPFESRIVPEYGEEEIAAGLKKWREIAGPVPEIYGPPEAPSGYDLATAVGTEFIDSLKDLTTGAADTASLLKALEDRPAFEGGVRPDTGNVVSDVAGIIAEVMSQGMLVPIMSLFEDTFGRAAQTPEDYAIIESALSEILELQNRAAPPEETKISEGLTNAMVAITNGIISQVDILSTIAEKPAVNVDVYTGVEKEIIMSQTITLDGAMLKRWISTYLAEETIISARTSGFGGTP